VDGDVPVTLRRAWFLMLWAGSAVAIAVVITGAGAGCDAGGRQAQCVNDPDCGANAACMRGTCLPKGDARTVAVEITPRTDSASTHTGLPAVNLGVDPITADTRVNAMGVMIDNMRAYSDQEHLVAVTPSPIPGQDDWRLETDVTMYQFTLGFGTSMLGAAATVWVQAVQAMPPAQGQPAISIATTLDKTIQLNFPLSSALIPVVGKLHDSLDAGAAGFLVRAYGSSDNVVSTTATTDADGTFKLLIAPGTVPSDLSGTISIHADGPVGADGMSTAPRFVSQPLLLSSVAGTANQPTVFRMPAFADRAPLRFTVQSTDADMIPGVTVLFRAQIPATSDGAAAIYEQQAISDANGEVEVMLIPGTVNAPLSYQISLVPPPDSTYASACVPTLPITMGGSGSQPQYSATLLLDYRVRLLGLVSGSDGVPASGVAVKATPSAVASDCVNAPPGAEVSATTGRDGHYLMLLDPGPYQLDVDPPLGAPLPRLTETIGVATDLNHDVALPPGEVIMGTVKAADASAMASAGIKIWDVLCTGSTTCMGAAKLAPALRAQSQTGADGTFRVVVPTLSPLPL
jgi:hypothetical protein